MTLAAFILIDLLALLISFWIQRDFIKELGAVHGYVLTAWAAAGVVGPLLLSLTHQLFHNYTLTLAAFIFINLLALMKSRCIQNEISSANRSIKIKAANVKV